MAWSRDRPSPRNRSLPGDWASRRRRVFERDGTVCHLCGEIGSETIDHVIAVVNGGTHELDNLAPAHAACARPKDSHEARQWHPDTRWPTRRSAEPHPGLLD